MSFSNFHTHCYFCDGAGDPEEYVTEAISNSFTDLGFSSHAPLPFSNSWTMKEENLKEYCSKINSLKIKYRDKLNIYLGLEIDYIHNLTNPTATKFEALNLDYTIGSVHMLKNEKDNCYLAVDGSEDEYIRLIKDGFHGDIKAFVHAYYTAIRNMVERHTPTIVGHLDLIKKHNKNNKYFDELEDWYKAEIIHTLNVISSSNAILELNTGGKVRGYTSDFYPSNWILEHCMTLNIPIILNSDSHNPKFVNAYFDSASTLLKKYGYVSQKIPGRKGLVEVRL